MIADKFQSNSFIIRFSLIMFKEKEEGQTKEQVGEETKKMQTKILIFKIILVVFALVCCITIIFILAKSSQFFSFLFTLATQTNGKAYLSLHFVTYLSSVYISIFGFILTAANTIIFFCKFTQKDKILWIHIVYFLIFFISGIVTISNKSYVDYMATLETTSITSPSCTLMTYINQCLLAPAFIAFKGDFISVFAVFTVFFIGYVIIYHYSVIKLLPYQIEKKQNQNETNDKKQAIFISNIKNETFVSQMFDEYT